MARLNVKGLLLVLGLFIAALFTGGVFTYGLFFFALFMVLVSYISGRSSYKSLVCIVWQSSDRLVAGDRISISIDLYNSGWLPMPYLIISANLPKRLTGEEPKPHIESVMPGIKASIKKDFVCRHRGVYDIGHVEVEFGDIFGLFRWKKIFDDEICIHVYPKLHILNNIELPVRQQFGTVAVKHNAYEDFASTKDIRKYQKGDSFKRMHWKVTAHRGDFFVRNVELNASANLNVFLDMYKGSYSGENAEDMEEKAAECAVSVVQYVLRQSMSVNFTAKGEKPLSISAKGINRFQELLDAVSKLSAAGDIPVSELVKREARKLSSDATIIVITPSIDRESAETYVALRTSGIEFVLIYLCENPGEINEELELLKGNSLRVYTVGLNDDVRLALGGYHER